MWMTILLASLGCYLLKLSGMVAPKRSLSHPRIQHIMAIMPVALLSALIAVQTFAKGQSLTIDARLAGLAVAAAAIRLRAPFLVVILSASIATAMLRMIEKA